MLAVPGGAVAPPLLPAPAPPPVLGMWALRFGLLTLMVWSVLQVGALVNEAYLAGVVDVKEESFVPVALEPSWSDYMLAPIRSYGRRDAALEEVASNFWSRVLDSELAGKANGAVLAPLVSVAGTVAWFMKQKANQLVFNLWRPARGWYAW